MNTHKYKIGDLVMYHAAFGSKATLGMIRAYDERYYLVDWHDWVPPFLRHILSEREIESFRNTFLNAVSNSDASPA